MKNAPLCFVARQEDGMCRSRLLYLGQPPLFDLKVPEDTIYWWKVAFQRGLPDRLRWRTKLEELSHVSGDLPKCRIREEGLQFTFLKTLSALHTVLGESVLLSDDMRHVLQKSIRGLLVNNKMLNLEARAEDQIYPFGMHIQGEAITLIFQGDSGESAISKLLWDRWLADPRLSRQKLLDLINNYEVLEEVLCHQVADLPNHEAVEFLMRSYANLSKTLVRFLEETSESAFVRARRRALPSLCASILMNEFDNFEDQKPYLERIFINRELQPGAKYQLLQDIFVDLLQTASNGTGNDPRLLTITSLITQFYLRQYDLDHAMHFWNRLAGKQALLRFVLSLYRVPYFYVAMVVGLLGVSLLPKLFPDTPEMVAVATAAGCLVLGSIILVSFIGASSLIIRILTLRGMDYLDLLLPRLLGAIGVGLTFLALDLNIWEASLRLDTWNWTFVFLGAYTVSFIFVFIDVHKTMRLLPMIPETASTANSRFHLAGSMSLERVPRLRTLTTSLRFFLIGVFGSLALTLVVSSLLALAVAPEVINVANDLYPEFTWRFGGFVIQALYDTSGGFIGVQWEYAESLSLILFPKLVLLWAGLALLIGAVAQLLWQDQQITSS